MRLLTIPPLLLFALGSSAAPVTVVANGPKAAVSGGAPEKASSKPDWQVIPDDVRGFLLAAQQADVFSLDPGQTEAATAFYGHRVLGKTTVSGETAHQLISTMLDGMDHGPSLPGACLRPRHGLRITKGSQTVEVIICFECGRTSIIAKGFAGPPGSEPPSPTTTPGPADAFNAILKKAHVPLPKN